MSKTFRISNSLSLPHETVTQKLAWLGTTGSGKTYGASKLAEEFWQIGAQFVVIDPVGVWYGLRLTKDGKKPSSITIPIFGGLHGDVPLESTGGALLANLVVDNDLSCIIDVSQFESDAEKARFATDFADRLFFRKKAAPSAMHLFMEECQEFVPQNPQRGEERMLHAFTRMQKLGRNFGIGSSYITQRPQEVNKKALNMAQTLFVFRTTGTHERAAIEKWIEDKSLDESIANDLPKLATGTCHVWSPEFLKMSETTHILEKETFNASATPEVGALAKKRELAPIDLEKVRTEMAATIEKAERDDPRLLRKKIAQLEKERHMEKEHPLTMAVEKKVIIEVPVLKDTQIARLEKIAERMYTEAQRHGEAMSVLWGNFDEISKAMSEAMQVLSKRQGIPHVAGYEPAVTRSEHKLMERVETIPSEGLSGPEQKILDGIRWMEVAGTTNPETTLVATLAGYSVYSSSYIKALSQLRGKTLVESQGKKIWLTNEGHKLAREPEDTPSSDELHNRILGKLDGPSRKIMFTLLKADGDVVHDDTLAASSGYSPSSSSYIKSKSVLRGKDLMESTGKMHAARDILFIP